MNDNGNSEIKRIKNEYQKRDTAEINKYENLYSPLNPAAIFIRHEIENHTANFLFNSIETGNIKKLKVLEVGCGNGSMLNMFTQLGFGEKNLTGIDLMESRLKNAAACHNQNGYLCANGEKLPFKNSSFDIVSQFTVFSSILNKTTKQNIAAEMKRVCKPGGIIIWYDMIHTNPLNKNLKGIRYGEIKELFNITQNAVTKRIILNPWILRPALKISKILCDILSAVKIFNSFYISFITVNK